MVSKPKQDLTQDIDKILLQVDAEECRRSLKKFVVATWPIVEPGTPFVDGWVVDCLVDHLEALHNGDIHRLLINIPPRHSKSTICLIWRAWCWTHTPEDRFLCASYSLSLSIRDNRRTRLLIESDWYQQRYGNVFHLSGDMNLKGRFENDQRGYNLAVSVGSATTGEGGSKLIIDDMHSAMEAYSEVERETALDWFKTVWSSRLNNAQEDKMLVIGQRIHDDDVSGYILKERPDWTHLNLPAEYEPDRHCVTSVGWSDPRRAEGELLWPERFSQESLNRLKRDLGSSGYSAQYQQSPVPATGGMFKEAWKRFFEIEGDYYILHTKYGHTKSVPIRLCRNEAVCDLAVSEKEQADFFVIETWAITPENECLLLHQLRGHFNNPDQQKKAIELYEMYRWSAFWVEQVAYQLAYIQQMRNYEVKEEIEPGVYRVKQVVSIPVRPWKPFRDKVARAGVAAVKMEAGDLYWLMGATYLPELEDEIFKFPKSKKKDQVDTHSMICDILSNPQIPLSGDPEPPEQLPTIEEMQADPFAWVGWND